MEADRAGEVLADAGEGAAAGQGKRLNAPGGCVQRQQLPVADLAQYILRNPFFVEKMTLEWPADMVSYRSRLNRFHKACGVHTPSNRVTMLIRPTDYENVLTD